jgi:diguanylate cyclase (GGDEF)-like protein/PAS domain S-box-containing protein
MSSSQLTPHQLRALAEEQLAAISQLKATAYSNDKLLHELQVHQIELQLQNEELIRSQVALEEMRDNYIDLYEFAPVTYLTLSEKGLIEEINLTGATLLGMERHKLLQRRFAGFIDSADVDCWHLFFARLLNQEQRQTIDLKLKLSDGLLFYVHLDCLRVFSRLDNRPSLRVILTDITQLKQAEADLRIAAVVFESQEGMIVTDANAAILRVNQAFTLITGYSAEEVIGKNPRLLQSGQHDKDFYAQMWKSIHSNGGWCGEIWNRRKNGEVYLEQVAITAIKTQDGRISNYVATFSDATKNRAATDEIERLAFYDPLTELPNRRLLHDRLRLAFAASHRSGRNAGLLFIDLDNFKNLNDTLGHDVGDVLLQQVAQRLKACIREVDMVARLGGDEFVVLLEGLSSEMPVAVMQTEGVGNKILEVLNQNYQLNIYDYHSTPSIGAIIFNGYEQTIEELLKRIDIAMYQAKATGRNTLCFFDPQMQAVITRRVAMEADLRTALAENQFRLYYQLQSDYNGQVTGAEVLIRWQHPQHGIISPVDFIPLAEETGLIMPIGQWVLETACAQIKAWQDNTHTQHLQLAVNVSARQFHQPDFVEQVCQMLNRHDIKPDRLKLELTESVVLDNVVETIDKMNALRKVGVCFSMDDFGTGYSSLAYLSQLPLDQLKIDQSFVRNIGVKPSDAIIVQTIIGMAHNLEIEVIAEGVETEAQRAFLKRHGCVFYQGYLFSEPLPIEQFEVLINPDSLLQSRYS